MRRAGRAPRRAGCAGPTKRRSTAPKLRELGHRGTAACVVCRRPQPTHVRLLVSLVLAYRVTLGRVMGGHCRYHPSCSQYALDAIAKYGPWRGGWRALKRIGRCHPWGGQGYDPA